MTEDEKLITTYKEAYSLLQAKVGEEVLKKHIDHYSSYAPKTIKDIFKRMLESLKNKQGYVNFIADTNDIAETLFDLDIDRLIKEFDNDWKGIFRTLEKRFGEKYKMDINNNRNAWVMYSKGVLSCTKFISNFKTVEEFDKFVKSFFLNEFTVAALPMLLEKEIFGYGFALACDFLKEIGYVKYGKPDIHLKDIFVNLNLVENDSDYEVFKKIVRIGLLVKEEPVVVDKVFWLIGSGNFHMSDIKIPRQKAEFIERTKEKFKLEKE
jgi:hypothetical protein